jgi:arginyl-tRNA synthetase
MDSNPNNNMIKSTISAGISHNKPTMFNISKYVQGVFSKAAVRAFPLPKDFVAQVNWNVTGSSDLASPSAMKIYNMNSRKEGWTLPSSKEVAQEIIANIEEAEQEAILGDIIISQQISNKKPEEAKKVEQNTQGKKKEKVEQANFFIDINLKDSAIEKMSNNILKNGISLTTEHSGRNVLCDFSSPNIAKEMHVGHLRSTILGDTICRILEFLGNDVKRINHVGDWGTQFGMLIAYLEETFPNYIQDKPPINDLEEFYRAAKKRFESDEDFKKKSQLKTVDLQKGDKDCREAWLYICEVSRREFNKIYERLQIRLEELGESFYDPHSRALVPMLEETGVVLLDQGAKIIKIPGYKIPLMLVKSDGGLNYDTSDLTALWYRLLKMDRDWVIYVVGSEQELHFKLIFEAGKIIGWHTPPKTRLDHMQFGLVLGPDGKKLASRTGDAIKLTDLLDEAKIRMKTELIKRNNDEKTKNKFTDEYIEEAANKIGYSAVKYFDLKQYRTTQYKFNYDHMLDPDGNTAVYLFYSYVRICSIYTKANVTSADLEKLIESHKIEISHVKERQLLLHLLKFNDVIEEIFEDLAPNKLCDYLYGIATKFSEFYEECKIVGNERMNSRLLTVEITRRFMKTCFDLLGLTPVEKL